MDIELKERFKGCIIGVGIGDALGAPVEGFTEEEIKEKYGEIKDYVTNKSLELKRGEYTDDTSMTLCILEALVENGFFDIHSIIKKFLKWFNEHPKGIGNTTFNALYLIEQGYTYDEASKMAYTTLSAGNGAAMRVAPIPLFDYKKGIETVVQDTIDASIITHYHPESIAGAIATSLIIYHNIHRGDKNKLIEFLLGKGREFIQNNKILNAIESVPEISENELQRGGYIVDTLKTSLWIFLNTENFIEAIQNSVNGGGDTDTIGAIVGAFAGSYYGIKNIPENYIKALKNSNYIMELAEKLYEISILDKMYF